MSDEKSQELEKDPSSTIDENAFDEMMLASRIEEKLNTERTYEGIPPVVRGSLAAILAREFIEKGVPPDFQSILKPLDKKGRDSVKSIPPAVDPTDMSVEGGRESQEIVPETPEQVKERTRKELAQRFTYEDESKIPPGVNPLQLDFLCDAARVGAFEWVKEYTTEMVVDYFTTDVTYVELAQRYGLTKQAVQERITRGMSKMRRVLYKNNPEIAQEDPYPLEQIQKGKNEKDIFKTYKHKQKRSQSIRAGLRRPSPETRRKPITDIFVPKQELP